MLIRKIATFSVRSERAAEREAERENAAIAERVRNAVDVFDEERAGVTRRRRSLEPFSTVPAEAPSATSDGCPRGRPPCSKPGASSA